jgi:hypothetical protein
MPMFRNIFEFYRSKEWENFRKVVIAERVREDGFVYDEYTNKPIVKAYDIILHHKIELTEENVHDYSISLNPENIMIVSHKSHNLIHNKLNSSCRKVFLIYGAPFAGKETFVKENMNEGDLIVDIDSIWECVSGCKRHTKPNRLKAVVFKTRDILLDSVKYRVGKGPEHAVVLRVLAVGLDLRQSAVRMREGRAGGPSVEFVERDVESGQSKRL